MIAALLQALIAVAFVVASVWVLTLAALLAGAPDDEDA